MSSSRFPDLPGGYPFPRLELEVLEKWSRERTFQATLERTRGGEPFLFYEGPPTANNVPHVGHVVTRVVKDLFPRYQTMRGRHVRRQAGWDTHGLPVEIEVEKRLGFSGKQDIEAYGVERFNAACLESVHQYERQWREMSERVGYWIDFDDAYFTYHNRYIESVWSALKKLWETVTDEGPEPSSDGERSVERALFQDYKIQPYCARCGTTLSSHEVAQNYQQADDPSIWALFRLSPGQSAADTEGEPHDLDGVALVGWTTTPWTTLANVGVAAHPDLVYKLVEHPERPGEKILFAEDSQWPVPLDVEAGDGRQRLDLRERPALARFHGRQLENLTYERFYPFLAPDTPGRVVLGDYVTAAEGTGFVHTAPPFGEDDFRTGTTYGLPLLHTVTPEGRIVDEGGPFAGLWFKDADPEIVRDLRERGLLLHSELYRHSYPFCWRCDQPLLYYATSSWFIRTSLFLDELLVANRSITWHPEHVGEGRFGKWLEGAVDWALSRKRYWGTPLPVWRCDDCPHVEVIGSFAELFQRAGRELPEDPYDRMQFDPHRPFVDRDHGEAPFVWSCPECGGGTVGRVEDVIDAWFDSGAMPFARQHFLPGAEESREAQPPEFPADFISEAVDQTRGWFYTLHVLGVLLFGEAAYRTCVVLGHINDEEGRKMSKRLGNVVDPMQVFPETGADALRWYFYANNPELTSRFSARLVREAAQAFLIPLWNATSFFTIYANLDGWRPGAATPVFADRPALDRWLLLRVDATVRRVTAALEECEIAAAARPLEELVDDLTDWYIRLSRDRFWAGSEDPAAGKESAYQALYETLTTLVRLLAPFTPFLAEFLHGHLVRSQDDHAEPSVHLERWPAADAARSEPQLEASMTAVQRIVRLGRAARNAHQLKTRQPLAAVTLVAADEQLRSLVEPHLQLLRDELNVHRIDWAEDRSRYVTHQVVPLFPVLGPRLGKRMPLLKNALAKADGNELAARLERDGEIRIELDGGTLTLGPEEVEVRLEERPGTATAGDRDLLVALDTRLTPELVAEGRAREVVNRLQQARKRDDLDYSDRIRVRYRAEAELAAAIETHREDIARETLAVELVPAPAEAELESAEVEGMDFAFQIEVVTNR